MSHVFTISPGQSFLEKLAAYVLKYYNDGSHNLTNLTLLLPTRRACRALTRILFSQQQQSSFFLPKILAFDDIDDDILSLHLPEHTLSPLPPVISPSDQLLILTRCIYNWKNNQPFSLAQSAHLAIELSTFLGEAKRHHCVLTELENIVPDDLTIHWQHVLSFLEIITKQWPLLLQSKEKIDRYDHRQKILALQSLYWENSAADYPVIIAGSTGSIPATAHLLKTIAMLDHGRVILPGLDLYMDETSWQALKEDHPQYGMQQFLKSLPLNRHHVQPLPCSQPFFPGYASEIMRPAITTEQWQNKAALSREDIDHIRLFETATTHEEALLIALQIRHALTKPYHTVALITHNRLLARRVNTLLKRWDIILNDSVGTPLLHTPGAVFLRLLAQMALSDLAPVDMLACLKHPLAAAHMSGTRFRQLVCAIELLALRGIRPGRGYDGIITCLTKKCPDTAEYFATLHRLLSPFLSCFQHTKFCFKTMLKHHLDCAESLATTDMVSGSQRLWQGEAGHALRSLLTTIDQSADQIGSIAPREYLGLIETLLSAHNYRPKHQAHPRAFLLTPLEARLLNFDTVILADLNEGSWPGTPSCGPWMSRSMRQTFKLAAPERQIGLEAHDFVQLLCSSHNIIITRSHKLSGAPTLASRWLLRLQTYLACYHLDHHIQGDAHWLQWCHSFYAVPAATPIAPPLPCPEIHLRPTALSATDIETLLRNPYGLYAAKILRLRPLDPVDEDPGAREFGTAIHAILDHFTRNHAAIPPDDLLVSLLEEGKKIFRSYHTTPAIWHLWWHRFERIAQWFIEHITQERQKILHIHSEITGSMPISSAYHTLTLKAKADRIEQHSDGHYAIIDYKTGTIPSMRHIRLGLSPQLIIEALIATHKGFNMDMPVISLAYWHIHGGEPPASIKNISHDTTQLINEARQGIQNLIGFFYDHAAPYRSCPDPAIAPGHNHYHHLARNAEWDVVQNPL